MRCSRAARPRKPSRATNRSGGWTPIARSSASDRRADRRGIGRCAERLCGAAVRRVRAEFRYPPRQHSELQRPAEARGSPPRPLRSGQTAWAVLDIGCGTGLSGAAIAPYAREIVGVDFLRNARESARARAVQTPRASRLVDDDAAGPTASYDVVFSTDVFIYVGKLEDVVEQTQRLLCPGGLFAFSVESLDGLVRVRTRLRYSRAIFDSTRRGVIRTRWRTCAGWPRRIASMC